MSMPLVFVVGDSISIQYGPYLEKELEGHFRYARKSGEEEALKDLDHPQGANGGDSSMVLDYLKAMRQDPEFRPDILLLNAGLHDIKSDPETGRKQVPIEQYEQNLRDIIALMHEIEAPLVWVRTTPVLDAIHNDASRGFHRYDSDLRAYNEVADKIMRAAAISLIDLHTFTEKLGDHAFCDHVHFTEEVRAQQATFIADYLKTHCCD
ncbi:MAG: SGNH/GDSL hydrolase family protein [Candidatus Sumerlaeia bacterium]